MTLLADFILLSGFAITSVMLFMLAISKKRRTPQNILMLLLSIILLIIVTVAASLHTSFYDFVNRYRIEEYGKYSLLGVAYTCGFNSKSSFYRAFRKETISHHQCTRRKKPHKIVPLIFMGRYNTVIPRHFKTVFNQKFRKLHILVMEAYSP